MSENSLVTVNILSFNRKDELRITLTKVFDQDYKNIEVIVVDNASSDGSAEMVKREFPDVKLARMEKNIGIAGWNEGFKTAKGEYILVLDDDSYPDIGSINNGIECITHDSKIGIVALRVYNKSEERFETDHINKNRPNTFIGCGAIIRKSIIEQVGGFSDLLFLYEHEIEFSMRVYNTGSRLDFCNNALIIHEGSLSNRIIKNQADLRRKFFLCRNYIVTLFLHFSYPRILILLPQLVFARLLMSLIEKNLLVTLKGFIVGLTLLPKILHSRTPLNKNVQKFYRFGNYMGRFVGEKRYTAS